MSLSSKAELVSDAEASDAGQGLSRYFSAEEASEQPPHRRPLRWTLRVLGALLLAVLLFGLCGVYLPITLGARVELCSVSICAATERHLLGGPPMGSPPLRSLEECGELLEQAVRQRGVVHGRDDGGVQPFIAMKDSAWVGKVELDLHILSQAKVCAAYSGHDPGVNTTNRRIRS